MGFFVVGGAKSVTPRVGGVQPQVCRLGAVANHAGGRVGFAPSFVFRSDHSRSGLGRKSFMAAWESSHLILFRIYLSSRLGAVAHHAGGRSVYVPSLVFRS